HPEFPGRVIGRLASITGIAFCETDNHFAGQSALDAVVFASSVLKGVAITLFKIANDIRLLGCGPRAGIAEIAIPPVQPGSSIMPGKVNPVIAESVTMVAAQVIGNDGAIAFCGAAGSLLELNVMMPLAAYDLLQSIAILAGAARNLATRCVDGITATDNGPRLVEQGLMLCTALAPRIGYDQAAAIAKEAFASGRTVREVARELTSLSDADHADDRARPRAHGRPFGHRDRGRGPRCQARGARAHLRARRR